MKRTAVLFHICAGLFILPLPGQSQECTSTKARYWLDQHEQSTYSVTVDTSCFSRDYIAEEVKVTVAHLSDDNRQVELRVIDIPGSLPAGATKQIVDQLAQGASVVKGGELNYNKRRLIVGMTESMPIPETGIEIPSPRK